MVALAADYGLDRKFLDRLARAMVRGRRALQFTRTRRLQMARKAAGSNWSEETARRRRYVNLLWNYQTVMCRNLIPKNPRCLLTTFNRDDKPTVAAMQSWVNRETERMNLAATLREWVLDALYAFGIIKVAIATPAEAGLYGWNRRAGSVMASIVDLDDYVVDPYARKFEEAAFEGHRYRVPLDMVLGSPVFDGPARRRLEAAEFRQYNADGDERIRMLGLGYSWGISDELEEGIDLWEVYLPRLRVVVTLVSDGAGNPDVSAGPLRVQQWVGPDCGPYHKLYFGQVTGNLWPVAPMMNLVDLDDAVNVLYRKLIEQAKRQKTVLPTREANEEDVRRLSTIDDGFAFRCDNPVELRELPFGGPHMANVQFSDHLRQLFDQYAGGLNLLGGRGPASRTATQDQMLNQNASAGVADMQETATAGVSGVQKACCWYWWHDPSLEMAVDEPIPNSPDLAFSRSVSPQRRQRGRWQDLDVRVDPFSLVYQAPTQRLQAMLSILQQVYLPVAQFAMQQGVNVDWNFLFRKAAEYTDQPDMQELLTVAEPPAPEAGGGAGGPPAPAVKPPVTERRYVRENVAQRTPQGDNMNLRNALAGVNPGGDPRRNGRQFAA